MAEFPQSAASRQALHDAAQSYLNHRILSGKTSDRAKEFNVTQKTIQRWRASLSGSGAQKRNPLSKSSTFSKRGKVTVKVKATYAVGGDAAYERLRELESDVPSSFFGQALADPDVAWETFLDSNVYPGGTIDNVQSIIFK